MAEKAISRMSVDDFFEWQKRQDKNYELVDGVPVLTVKAMTGASARHDTITVNVLASLHARLRGTPCRPRTSDQSVLTFRGTRRPDISIECGKPPDKSMATVDPRVVIEVLSPSTTRYDRFQKLEEYKQQKEIKVILLIDTGQPRVIVWRRTVDNWSSHEIAGLDASIDLPEIGTELPLTEMYLDVDFSQLE